LGCSPPTRRPQGTPACTSPPRMMPSAPNDRQVATAMSPPEDQPAQLGRSRRAVRPRNSLRWRCRRGQGGNPNHEQRFAGLGPPAVGLLGQREYDVPSGPHPCRDFAQDSAQLLPEPLRTSQDLTNLPADDGERSPPLPCGNLGEARGVGRADHQKDRTVRGDGPAGAPTRPGQRRTARGGAAGRAGRHAEETLLRDEPRQPAEIVRRGGVRHHQASIGRNPGTDGPGRLGPAGPQHLQGEVVNAPPGLSP
jgi:hypothetical protein